jgi:hypothetical protein
MGTYVVERYLTGWTRGEVAGLLDRLDRLANDLQRRAVIYLGSLVLDDDETCLSVFEGPDLDQVRHANLDHGLPTNRVVAAALSGIATNRQGTRS